MVEKTKFSLFYAQAQREMIPKILETGYRTGSEFGHFTTWLVGLSTTLLAVGAANPEQLRALLPTDYEYPVSCLLITIIAGVLYRVVDLWISQTVYDLATRLYGFFIGFASAPSIHIIPELDEDWDQAGIVRQIKKEFDMDYSFLLEEPHASIEQCRKAYQTLVDIDVRFEKGRMDALYDVASAHYGLSKSRVLPERDPKAALEKTRRRASRFRILSQINNGVFTISALSFVVAMGFIAKGLWVL